MYHKEMRIGAFKEAGWYSERTEELSLPNFVFYFAAFYLKGDRDRGRGMLENLRVSIQ